MKEDKRKILTDLKEKYYQKFGEDFADFYYNQLAEQEVIDILRKAIENNKRINYKENLDNDY